MAYITPCSYFMSQNACLVSYEWKVLLIWTNSLTADQLMSSHSTSSVEEIKETVIPFKKQQQLKIPWLLWGLRAGHPQDARRNIDYFGCKLLEKQLPLIPSVSLRTGNGSPMWKSLSLSRSGHRSTFITRDGNLGPRRLHRQNLLLLCSLWPQAQTLFFFNYQLSTQA